jgi:predicted nucleic acid-binding protein
VKRILIDTSVYVDWFRAGRHEEIVAGRHGPPSLSSVVAMELLAGGRASRALTEWATKFWRSGRMLIPTWEVWKATGPVLRELRRRGTGSAGLTNDALIAMTARTEGLRVVTRNGSDFARIAAIEPFDLEIVT